MKELSNEQEGRLTRLINHNSLLHHHPKHQLTEGQPGVSGQCDPDDLLSHSDSVVVVGLQHRVSAPIGVWLPTDMNVRCSHGAVLYCTVCTALYNM